MQQSAEKQRTALTIPGEEEPRKLTEGVWRIETLTTLADIRKYKAEWLALEKCCSDLFVPFQSYEWCEAWAAQYSARAAHVPKPKIFLIYKGETLAALLPMMLSNHRFAQVLTLFGEPHSQVANVLVMDGIDARDGLRLCVEQAAMLTKADVVTLGPMDQDCMLARALDTNCISADPADYMSLVTWPAEWTAGDYLQSLSKNRRKDFHRKQRAAEARGVISFDHYGADEPEFKPLIHQALGWKKDWLIANGMVSVGLSQPGVEAFLSGFGAHQGSHEVELEVLSCNNEPFAICINLVGNGVRNYYLVAYDPTFIDVSPGMLVHQYSIHNSVEEGKYGVNFLGHPTPFKDMWCNERVPLVRYQKSLTPRGRVWLEAWVSTLRPAVKNLFVKLRNVSKWPLIGPFVSKTIAQIKPQTNRK